MCIHRQTLYCVMAQKLLAQAVVHHLRPTVFTNESCSIFFVDKSIVLLLTKSIVLLYQFG